MYLALEKNFVNRAWFLQVLQKIASCGHICAVDLNMHLTGSCFEGSFTVK